MAQARLHVLSGAFADLRRLAAQRVPDQPRPDLVVVRDGPWRLRWRTPTASLAGAFGVFHAAGGKTTAGNTVLAGLRVQVDSVRLLPFALVPGRPMRAAVIMRGQVGGNAFVVAGVRLADEPDERSAQSAVLARALAEETGPLIVCGNLDPADLPSLTAAEAGQVGPNWIMTGPGVRLAGVEAGAPMTADITLGEVAG